MDSNDQFSSLKPYSYKNLKLNIFYSPSFSHPKSQHNRQVSRLVGSRTQTDFRQDFGLMVKHEVVDETNEH